MPFAEIEGSETITTAEHDLLTDTAGPDSTDAEAVYQVHLNLSALAAGDSFELKGYSKVETGGTQREFMNAVFTGAQGAQHHLTPAFHLKRGISFTLKKLAGTDRAITWSILKVV